MASQKLEQRVATLEAQVGKLVEEVRAARSGPTKDWRRTIGAFTDDEGMQQILRDAMQLRDVDRKQAKAKRTAKGKNSR